MTAQDDALLRRDLEGNSAVPPKMREWIKLINDMGDRIGLFLTTTTTSTTTTTTTV